MRRLQLDHFGAGGVHGRDIVRRGFLSGISVTSINSPDDAIPDSSPSASLLTVPIRHTSELIGRILERRGPEHPIIDCSGIMRSLRSGLPFARPHVHHLHCLFGPQGTGSLNAIYCRGSERSIVFEHMLNNIALTDGDTTIQLTPTSLETHDVAMALVQGITHSIATLLAEKNTLPEAMRTRRKGTPANTIADMIHLNPRVLSQGEVLHTQLISGRSFRESWDHLISQMQTYLNGAQLPLTLFKTPFFQMLSDYIQAHPVTIEAHDIVDIARLPLTELATRIQKSQE